MKGGGKRSWCGEDSGGPKGPRHGVGGGGKQTPRSEERPRDG